MSNNNEAIFSEFTPVVATFGEGGIASGEMTITPIGVEEVKREIHIGDTHIGMDPKIDPALLRGVTVRHNHDHTAPRSHKPHVNVGRIGGRQVDHGPARGAAMAAALGLALAASSKTVQDFPRAPERPRNNKQRPGQDNRPANARGPKPDYRNKGNNPIHRTGNRGK